MSDEIDLRDLLDGNVQVIVIEGCGNCPFGFRFEDAAECDYGTFVDPDHGTITPIPMPAARCPLKNRAVIVTVK